MLCLKGIHEIGWYRPARFKLLGENIPVLIYREPWSFKLFALAAHVVVDLRHLLLKGLGNSRQTQFCPLSLLLLLGILGNDSEVLACQILHLVVVIKDHSAATRSPEVSYFILACPHSSSGQVFDALSVGQNGVPSQFEICYSLKEHIERRHFTHDDSVTQD